jgi:RNA polymerase sigma factor (sigma-70 family)
MPTHAEQAALCVRARAGDRQAYDALALSVWAWCRRKAGHYARQYGSDADDLEAVGLSRLPHAVQNYDPAHGTFLNYFAACASRQMIGAARKEVARREVQSDEAMAREPGRDGRDAPRDAAVTAALAGLDPVGRALVSHLHGIGRPRLSLERVRKRLGLSKRRAAELYRLAFNRLSDVLVAAERGADGPHP